MGADQCKAELHLRLRKAYIIKERTHCLNPVLEEWAHAHLPICIACAGLHDQVCDAPRRSYTIVLRVVCPCPGLWTWAVFTINTCFLRFLQGIKAVGNVAPRKGITVHLVIWKIVLKKKKNWSRVRSHGLFGSAFSPLSVFRQYIWCLKMLQHGSLALQDLRTVSQIVRYMPSSPYCLWADQYPGYMGP